MSEQIAVRLPDGVRLHARVSGPPTAAVTVLLLHGWTLDGRIWHRQRAALTAAFGDDVRVVSYDARGHGRSSVTPLRAATLDQLGDDLARVIAECAGGARVVLAGHSLGGMTIMEYAHRHPVDFAARVSGLLFVSTTAEGHTHTVYGLSPRIARLIRLAETTGAGVLARCGSWRPPRALLRALRPALRWMLFGDACAPEDIRLATAAVARASLRSIGAFRGSVGAQHRLDTLAALGDLPAAALVGDRDRLTPPPCAESIAAALPTTELTVCPGAGHMLMLERPHLVDRALLDITRRVLDGRTGRPDADATPTGEPPTGAPSGRTVPAPRRPRRTATGTAPYPVRGPRPDHKPLIA